jgi:hypothetical protein
MFNFKTKIVNPLVRAALSEIDFAFKVEGADKKVEKLLSVDEMVKSEFEREEKYQQKASSQMSGLAAVGMIVAIGGLLVSGGAVLAGFALAMGGFAAMTKYAANVDRLTSDKNTLHKLIGTEIARVTEESPAEVIKSPRFLRSISNAFKSVAEDKLSGKPEALRARVAFTPATPAL